MSKSYLDEESCVVCSYMTSGTPKTMVTVDSGLNVFHGKPNKKMLRQVDVKVKEDFMCKKPFASFLGFAGFLIGFGAGFAALGGAAAMALVMGPVGWAILALAIIAIALVAAFSMANNKCNSALSGQLWKTPNQVVNFKGKHAIHQASTLLCPQGGLIRAIPDPALAASTAESIAAESMKGIGLKVLSQAVYGFVTGAFTAKTGGVGTSLTGAATINFGAVGSTLAFGGIGYYAGEVTNTHGGAAVGTGAAVTVQPYVDDFASGITRGNFVARYNAWRAFRPGISEMPLYAFFKGMRPGNLVTRARLWYRFNPTFVKGLGIGVATWASDAFIIDPVNGILEDNALNDAQNAAGKSSGMNIQTQKF